MGNDFGRRELIEHAALESGRAYSDVELWERKAAAWDELRAKLGDISQIIEYGEMKFIHWAEGMGFDRAVKETLRMMDELESKGGKDDGHGTDAGGTKEAGGSGGRD